MTHSTREKNSSGKKRTLSAKGRKAKGIRWETKLVNLLAAVGLKSRRFRASDGRSAFKPQEADVEILLHGWSALVQCKNTKKLPKWLGMDPKIHMVALKEDRQPGFRFPKYFWLIPNDLFLPILRDANKYRRMKEAEWKSDAEVL